MSVAPSRFTAHPKSTLIALNSAAFLSVELIVRLLVYAGVLAHVPAPTTERPLFWDDINPQFGYPYRSRG